MHAASSSPLPARSPRLLSRLAGPLALALAPASLAGAQTFPVASTLKLADGQNGFVKTATGAQTKGALGTGAAPAGDVDGDGTPDLLLCQTENLTIFGGRVYVCFLRPDGTVRTSTEIGGGVGGLAGTIDTFDAFGEDVAWLGDLDGDGTAEIAVGAPGDDDGVGNGGAVWILSLNADGSVARESKISQLTTPGLELLFGDAFGHAVESLGDLDGDGVCDLAVGAPRRDDGGADRGAFWVLRLLASGGVKAMQRVSSTAGLFTGVLDDDGRFGSSLARLGDLDGNGSLELAVGQPQGFAGAARNGSLWIVSVFTNGLVLGAKEIEPGQNGFSGPFTTGEAFGEALEPLGDLDGDGTPDLAVGAPGHDAPSGFDQGALWLLYLRADGSVRVQDLVTRGEGGLSASLLKNGDALGASIALLGRAPGSARIRLAVGAPGDDDAGSSAGAAHVLSLDFCPHLAEAVYRNVPGNPSSYAAPPPVLGELWKPTVDLRTTGHAMAWIFGMTDAFQLPLGGGQTLLVIDATGSGELLGIAPQPGPLARFEIEVPRDGSFCGVVVHTQAAHLGGGKTFALSNAQDLVLGFGRPRGPALEAPAPLGL